MALLRRLRLVADPERVFEHVAAILAVLPCRWRHDGTRIGLVEALANAIQHGVLGLPPRSDLGAFFEHLEEHSPRTDGASIDVFVSCRETVARIRVRDSGRGFDWRRTRPLTSRGLGLMLASFQSVRWSGRGNSVELTLRAKEAVT